MMVTALYAAACGLFLIYLSARVIMSRAKLHISVGHENDPAMERAMRVQANFTEFVPIALILLALAEMQGLPLWSVHVIGLGLVAARIIHFIGFRSKEAPGIFRTLGAASTFMVIIALCVILPTQFYLNSN